MGKNLKEKLGDELKESLLKRDAEKTGVLRFVLSLLQNREIEKRGTGQSPVLGDEEIIEIMQREVKKRKEAIELFKKGRDRLDLKIATDAAYNFVNKLKELKDVKNQKLINRFWVKDWERFCQTLNFPIRLVVKFTFLS